MSGRVPRTLLLVSLLGVAACSYAPPNVADESRPSYQTDLAACQASGEKAAHHLVMTKGGLFLTYPISLPIEEKRQTTKCMDAKGYAASK